MTADTLEKQLWYRIELELAGLCQQNVGRTHKQICTVYSLKNILVTENMNAAYFTVDSLLTKALRVVPLVEMRLADHIQRRNVALQLVPYLLIVADVDVYCRLILLNRRQKVLYNRREKLSLRLLRR